MPHQHQIASDPSESKQSNKRRGNYNCGRCGQPKKGHVCNLPPQTTTTTTPAPETSSVAKIALPYSNLRRVLSFKEPFVEFEDGDEVDGEDEEEDEAGRIMRSGLFEVMRRLSPMDLMAAAKVCVSWRDVSKKVWRSVEELKLRVPKRAMVGSVLKKCHMLTKLVLKMESDVDATTLACIAFSCPNLESMEIAMCSSAVNRITGDELSRFAGDKCSLTSLKMEGCSNLGSIVISSSTLATLWLSDLNCLSKMIFNCPNLQEISLDFSRVGNDNTNLIAMADGLGRGCPMLQNIHIASARLTHRVVLALTASNLRDLRMLSLVLGTGITDASVAAIASSYPELELLDLSGSSISDSGIGMICGVFPETLSQLLLAMCHNVTTSGIQFATAQLPLLELMDCGMTVSYPDPECPTPDEDVELPDGSNMKLQFTCQKLIVKHDRLRKFSLWGCSALDALYLNCPRLSDLNLNSCKNLQPEKLVLQCPNLNTVHTSGCSDKLIKVIENQVSNHPNEVENYFPIRRMPDSSKRVRVPLFIHQPATADKKEQSPNKRQCNVHVG